MENLYQWIISHAKEAPFALFGLFLLAGLNVPIPIDILLIIAALVSATCLPKYTLILFLSCFLGCYFSAQLSYWFGRLVAIKLLKFPFAKKILNEERLVKMHDFYKKYGFRTLLVGRFIPFGVRNALFMSTGISKSSFLTFALRDFFTSFLWSSTFFTLFYQLGANYDLLVKYTKLINIGLFLAFGVTVIAVIWYKRRRHKKT